MELLNNFYSSLPKAFLLLRILGRERERKPQLGSHTAKGCRFLHPRSTAKPRSAVNLKSAASAWARVFQPRGRKPDAWGLPRADLAGGRSPEKGGVGRAVPTRARGTPLCKNGGASPGPRQFRFPALCAVFQISCKQSIIKFCSLKSRKPRSGQ